MKKLRFLAGVLLSIFLFAGLQAPVLAETADITSASNAAANSIKQSLAAPSLSDGRAVFALLRGGYITPTENYTQSYIQSIINMAQTGGANSQPIAQTAWQVLSLQAAGVDVSSAAPALLEAIANREALDAQGFSAQYMALLVFGAAKNPVPQTGNFNVTALVDDFAAQVNEDNGFGPNGISNAVSTAQAIQALSAHASSNPAAYTVLENAQFWLQLNTNDEGGFDNGEGVSSSDGVAEAMLAMSALGYDPASVSFESAYLAQVLIGFQNAEGAIPFQHDAPATAETTALGLAGLAAKVRFDRGSKFIFDTSDVPPMELSAAASSLAQSNSSPPVSQSDATAGNEGNKFPLWLTLGAGGTLVFTFLMVFFFALRGKGKSKNSSKTGASKKQNKAAPTKSQTDTDKQVYRKPKE